MTPLELSRYFLSVYFSGRDLQQLQEILRQDVRFIGPFFQCHSAAQLIESFKESPTTDMSYIILKSFENDNEACLHYEVSYKDLRFNCVQLFQTSSGKISHTELIFDPRELIKALQENNV